MRISLVTLMLGVVCASSAVHAFETEDKWIEGTWVAHSRNGQIVSHITIKDCGNGTPCGTLVWIDPRSSAPKLDGRNPNISLRTRTLIGSAILEGFTKHRTGWRGGNLYNPEDGKTFASSVARGRDQQLLVTGCLGPFCQTKSWRKVVND